MNRRRWRHMWNPWEWLKFFYENVGHKSPILSGVVFVVAFAVTGWIVWWRLDTQYKNDHPHTSIAKTTIPTSSSSQNPPPDKPPPVQEVPLLRPSARVLKPDSPKVKEKQKSTTKAPLPIPDGNNYAPGGVIQDNRGSSGNNKQEVVILPGRTIPRSITEGDFLNLVDGLSHLSGTVRILAADEGEGNTYSRRIQSAFEQAGTWRVIRWDLGNPMPGAYLIPAKLNVNDLMGAVAKALKSAKVDFVANPTGRASYTGPGSLDDGADIVVVVGQQTEQ
jgi:hypothetical protein